MGIRPVRDSAPPVAEYRIVGQQARAAALQPVAVFDLDPGLTAVGCSLAVTSQKVCRVRSR